MAEVINKLFINGEFVESHGSDRIEVRNPKDNSIVSSDIPVADEEDVNAAVGFAEKAMSGEWGKYTGPQRSKCLNKLADLIEEKGERYLNLDSLCTGNTVQISQTRDKPYMVNTLRYFAGFTDKVAGEHFPADDGMVKFVKYEPLGVCAGVNPWNSPLASTVLKMAPCLASGNTIIIKPSEKSPLGTVAFCELVREAGFPKGVFQVLTGGGTVGALLASHMRIRKISFTGSIATGKKIQIMAAQSNLKRCTLELGGKSPAVIFDDANLDNAIKWCVNAITIRSGQLCMAASRLYVQKEIADEFIKRYVSEMKAKADALGDPQDPNTLLGPLIDESQYNRVMEYIEQGKKEAQFVTGGRREGKGFYVEPTVFLNPKPDAKIYREEIFGPVAVVNTFETEQEVLERCNDSEFGLMAGVFTQDIQRALRMADNLESGVVGVNCVSQISNQVPFGGVKQSGIGREMGIHAMRAFTEPKTVLINMNY